MASIVVISAQAGTQYFTGFLNARVRGHDNERLLQPISRQVIIYLEDAWTLLDPVGYRSSIWGTTTSLHTSSVR